MRLSFLALTVAGCVAGFLPSLAAAQSQQETAQQETTGGRAPEPEVSAWDRAGLRGIEIQAGAGPGFGGGGSPVQAPNLYGSAFQSSGLNPAGTILNPGGAPAGQSFTPYSYDPFGFSLSAGYRFLPSWSVGGFFSYANYETNGQDADGDQPDGTGGLTRVRWAVGGYGRFYLTSLSSRLQPWVEVGIGYVNDSASYAHPLGPGVNNGGGPDNGNYLLNYHGLTIPIGVGLDWRLAPIFAVGPFVTYEEAIPINGCVQITVDQSIGGVGPVSTCGSVVEAHAYGSFMAGIFAKLTFGPAVK